MIQTQAKKIPQPIEMQSPTIQAKSNEEGLAEWEAQRQKWARLGSPWMDKVPNPSGELAQPWIQSTLKLEGSKDFLKQETGLIATQDSDIYQNPLHQISEHSHIQPQHIFTENTIQRIVDTESLKPIQYLLGNKTIQKISQVEQNKPSLQNIGLINTDNILQKTELNETDKKTLSYENLVKFYSNPKNEREAPELENESLSVGLNNGLFIEISNALGQDKVKDIIGQSSEEKLHVPANADDISQRFAIVSDICIAHDIPSFKVANLSKYKKSSGSRIIFDELKKSKLLDSSAEFNDSQEIAEIIKKATDFAITTWEVSEIAAYTKEKETNIERMIEGGEEGRKGLSSIFAATLDNKVNDAEIYPTEQSGREITIYCRPGVKTVQEWTSFAMAISSRFQKVGLPKLPIAKGDHGVKGDVQNIKGQDCGYFSYRNEAMAVDHVLGYRGFPHWIGGNAKEYNAAKEALNFDKVDLSAPILKSSTVAKWLGFGVASSVVLWLIWSAIFNQNK